MADYLIKDTTLTNIADAIRAKKSSTDTYTPAEMATAISSIETGGGGGPTAEDLTFTGDLQYFNYYGRMSKLIKKYGSQMSFNYVSNMDHAFQGNDTLNSDFSNWTINLRNHASLINAFCSTSSIKKLPKFAGGSIDSCSSIFYDFNGENIPDDLFTNTTFNLTSTANRYHGMFTDCHYLKKVPSWFSNAAFNTASHTFLSYANIYYSTFRSCWQLNEIIIPLVLSPVELNQNCFDSCLYDIHNARKIVFAPSPDSTNESCNWKNQVIDLTIHVGYGEGDNNVSVRGDDKKIYDATTYAALKNDPNAWTKNLEYSFYNHDSALETLNSLPYTGNSASQSSPNIIKFNGESGSATDGGAINTLTTAEIAQATNRCWSVSYV